MKMFLLTLVLSGAALFQVQAQVRDNQVVNDIGDAEVATIASRLGLHYKELGMGNNRLGRGRNSFYVSVPDADNEGGPTTPAERRKQTLDLNWAFSRKHFSPAAVRAWNALGSGHFSTAEVDSDGVSLTAKLFLVDGVTFRTVLEHFRRFRDEIKAFETHPERD